MSNPTITLPDGSVYEVDAVNSVSLASKQNSDGSLTITPSVQSSYSVRLLQPAPSAVPAIPSAAGHVNLDNLSSWKGEWDDTTPKTASGSTSFVDAATGRKFTVTYSNRAGLRFSCHAVNSGCFARNWVYRSRAKFNWSQISRWEVDINQVADGTRVYMMCLQLAAGGSLGSGKVELTFSNTSKSWNPSNVAAPLSSWADGTEHTIEWHASRDDSGVVNYQGIGIDGVWSAFSGNNVGPSVKNLRWSPNGLILPNFQFEGSQASGTITGTASSDLYYW